MNFHRKILDTFGFLKLKRIENVENNEENEDLEHESNISDNETKAVDSNLINYWKFWFV